MSLHQEQADQKRPSEFADKRSNKQAMRNLIPNVALIGIIIASLFGLSSLAYAQNEAAPSTVNEFAASGPLGVWRTPEGKCATVSGQWTSPLTLADTSLTFSTLSCETSSYERIGDLTWRLTASCQIDNRATALRFVLVPLGDAQLVMSILAADHLNKPPQNYILERCQGTQKP